MQYQDIERLEDREMPNRKEPFRARGTLRGQGRERSCSVEGSRTKVFVNELSEPVKVILDTVRVTDRDDFPDGDYELTFDGETHALTREGGHYLARRR